MLRKYNIKIIKEIIVEEISENDRLKLAFLIAKKREVFAKLLGFDNEIKLENLDSEELSGLNEIKFEYIFENILYIRVGNSSINHYMYTNKNKFLEKINEVSKEVEFIIDDIQIKVR